MNRHFFKVHVTPLAIRDMQKQWQALQTHRPQPIKMTARKY